MMGKCKAIAHGSTDLDHIFRERKLDKTLNLRGNDDGERL